MSLASQVSTALVRVGTEFKNVYSKQGDLASLATTNKSNLVAALNELKSAVSSASGINDTASSTSATYSSSKVISLINQAKTDLINGAPTALDTFAELAAQMSADETAAASLTTAVGNRLRYDAAQTLTTPQQTQAQTNLGVLSAAAIGDPATDFTAVFVAALA